MISAIPDKR